MSASTDRKSRKKHYPFYSIHISGAHLERQIVPSSPTMEMLNAAVHALDGVDLSKLSRKDRAKIKAAVRWQAMLKAAPKLA